MVGAPILGAGAGPSLGAGVSPSLGAEGSICSHENPGLDCVGLVILRLHHSHD